MAAEAVSLDMLLDMWNSTIINFPLTVADLTTNMKPALIMGALLEILTEFGVDRDAILAPPPEEERDEHTEYYWDLIPIMNITRAVNYIASVIPGVLNFTVMHILMPSPLAAQSILLFLVNNLHFNRSCRVEIEPLENEIFQQRDQVTALEQEKDKLLELLNEQAAAKASRAMRLEKMEEDKKRLSEELKREKREHETELHELEQVLAQNRELEALVEQRKAQKEALAAELARVRAQKVNDAEDIKSQHKQAVRNEKEVIEKVNALREMLVSKETTVRNLLSVNAKVDEAIHYLLDISKLTESMKEVSKCVGREEVEVEGAVSERRGELTECAAQLEELQRERRAAHERHEREAAGARAELARAQSALKEAVVRCKKGAERAQLVSEEVQEIKKATEAYEAEKQRHEHALDDIQTSFYAELKSFEDIFIQKSKTAAKTLENKLSKFHEH